MANKMADKKKNASRSQMAEVPSRSSEKEQSAKAVRAAIREERKEQPKQDARSTRRDVKRSASLTKRLRNNPIGRFILEAYYELRYKVTWPTFREARNMTIIVIIISVIIGGILALVDLGLYRLFLLINGQG